jgi:hypothetical protein
MTQITKHYSHPVTDTNPGRLVAVVLTTAASLQTVLFSVLGFEWLDGRSTNAVASHAAVSFPPHQEHEVVIRITEISVHSTC